MATQKGLLDNSCAWTLSVDGGKPGEGPKHESGRSGCSVNNW